MKKLTLVVLVACGVLAMTVGVLSRVTSPSNDSEWKRLQSYAHKDGAIEAESDWSSGRPRWITYGGPAFDLKPGDEVLRRRLGVTREHIAFCSVTQGAEKYTRDYNRVMWLRLTRQYGADTVRRALMDAAVYPFDSYTDQANKSLQPTATAVTFPAGAGNAPAVAVAEH